MFFVWVFFCRGGGGEDLFKFLSVIDKAMTVMLEKILLCSFPLPILYLCQEPDKLKKQPEKSVM